MFPVNRKVVRGGSGMRVGDGVGDGRGVAEAANGVGGTGDGVSVEFSKGMETVGEGCKVGVEAWVGTGAAGGLQAEKKRTRALSAMAARPIKNIRARCGTWLKPVA